LSFPIPQDTLPETKYTWEDWTKQINPPKPQRESHSFENHSARTRIDLNYKTGKNADVEREDFDFIRHSKIGFFSGVVGVAAIPALFKFSSLILGTPALVWQILTLLSLIWTVFFTVPYVAKAIYYPHKVRAEWQHPSMNNAFSLPSFLIMIYAFLAWDTYSTPLARVLWWAGASTSTLLAVIVVGNWLSTARHEGHVTGAMAMPPVGLFVAAIVGPIVDPAYTDVSFLFFGFAIIMWITLFVMHFQRTIVGHNADPRQRMFASIWFAAPAAGSIAWAVLNAPPGGPYLMDSVSQTLFYIAISLALVCVWMSWRRFLWADRFFMQMWAWGFPTAALAWAALLYGTLSDLGFARNLFL
jgi:tellurite resistance protein